MAIDQGSLHWNPQGYWEQELSNGWNKKATFKGVEPVKSRLVTPLGTEIDEQTIKRELAEGLANFLMKEGIIQLKSEMDSFNQSMVYEADVLVVGDRKVHKARIEEDVFMVDGQSFDQDQIIEALRNTFPEYFI